MLMLLEKLPTGMTKLRSGSLSVQLDSHERWEIVAAQTVRDRVQMKTTESAKPQFALHRD